MALQSHVGNEAVQRLLKNGLTPSIQRKEDKKPPAAIGYVGLNPAAEKEANALKRGARDQVIVSPGYAMLE